jgi:hypothetical protein
MTLYFVRWPMEIEADIRDEHPICSNCEDDWGSLDGADSAIIERIPQQQRCPACGSWIDRPGATNAL